MLVYRGETRFLAVDLAAALATGDALTGDPTVEIVVKRGRTATTLLVADPAPALSGTEIQFWVEVPADQEPGIYLALVSCDTQNTETVKDEAPLIVQ